MTEAPRRIAIIGCGLMGAGIAQVFAAAGHRVSVHEPAEAVRETIHARIAANLTALEQDTASAETVAVFGDLLAAVADAEFVFEAAPEKLPLKRAIFADLVEHAPASAILASNTSVIPITDIVQGLETAERMAGTHWWNPPYLVPLVEVVQTMRTGPATVTALMGLLKGVGKAPVHVKKDVPGFVANRLQHALWREAIAIVAAGICDAETVDTCVKQSFGLRLPVLGPLENADLVGLDLTLDIHNVILPAIDSSPAPSPLLRALVDKGELGFKTGKGFRAWSQEDMANVRAQLTRHLKRALSGSETA